MTEPIEDSFYALDLADEDSDSVLELLAEGIKGNKQLLQEARSELKAARKCIYSRTVLRDFVRKHFNL